MPTAWAPKNNADLRAAIKECLGQSTDCSKGPRGPIGAWDIYAVTNMGELFIDAESEPKSATEPKPEPVRGANKFNGDLSKWDVLDVMTMHSMFQHASAFNADISK